MQVKALHAASAALALAVLVNGDHDDRAAGALHQPGSHDANDAGMPVPSPQQHDAVVQPLGLLFQQFLGSFEDLLLSLLPVGVDLVQLVRQFLGPVRSSQSTSCKAVTALSMRPAALMRGAMA